MQAPQEPTRCSGVFTDQGRCWGDPGVAIPHRDPPHFRGYILLMARDVGRGSIWHTW